MKKLLYKTKSVCPTCLRELTAEICADLSGVYMEKNCEEHGFSSTLIWADSAEAYLKWLEYGGIDPAGLPTSEEDLHRLTKGLNFGCDACQQASSAALMTTNRCNMNCPVCFTRDKKEPLHEPDLNECRKLMQLYRDKAGSDSLIEFCGGEPTVREDIFDLAETARDLGFDYIQLNTNGIRLAESVEYCKALKKSGITTVYMGFDGITNKPYYAKYGRSLLETKKKAVENCAKAQLAVVLVTCVIPNENDTELGEIVRYAVNKSPTVRGVYLQPISYFGIYPEDKIRRITIPDIIRKLAQQHEDIGTEDFGPGAYEHAQCSFQACYMLDKKGKLNPLTRYGKREIEEDAVHRLRKNMRATWMPSQQKLLTIGGMAFQDAWNIDLLRVKQCSIQIIQKDGKLIPLCSKFLSNCNGDKLFSGIG